MLLDSAAG